MSNLFNISEQLAVMGEDTGSFELATGSHVIEITCITSRESESEDSNASFHDIFNEDEMIVSMPSRSKKGKPMIGAGIISAIAMMAHDNGITYSENEQVKNIFGQDQSILVIEFSEPVEVLIVVANEQYAVDKFSSSITGVFDKKTKLAYKEESIKGVQSRFDKAMDRAKVLENRAKERVKLMAGIIGEDTTQDSSIVAGSSMEWGS